MRVITGSARGRRLKELQGMDTRPTTDRVKEALFSVIQFDIEGRRVLDLFAGTGQLGIEALSRGAAHCTFLDTGSDATALIRDNLEHTGLSDRALVRQMDFTAFLSGCHEKFDLLFLDPPYQSPFLAKALDLVQGIDIMTENGIIVCESPVEKEMPELTSPYGKVKDYRYGKIKLTKYQRSV
jgi:16S rRNA (guanine966-N2)-methyltransferase